MNASSGAVVELHPDVEVVFATPETDNSFFGYYDVSPFDAAGERILAHRTAASGRPITPNDAAEVGYYDLPSGRFTRLGETHAFNWQQGARLQWLPPDYETRVIYNDRGADGFHAVVVDVTTGARRRLPVPVHVVHPGGRVALSVSYARLQACRPSYSYAGSPDPKWDVPAHPDDGIHRVDLETGAVEQLISTAEVVTNEPLDAFEREPSWLMHPLWSPGGDRFAFLHRWNDPQGATRERLYTADADGEDLHMFPDTQLYTHLSWRDAETLTVWGLPPSPRQRMETVVRTTAMLRGVVVPLYRWARSHVPGMGQRVSQQGVGLPQRVYMDYTDRTDRCERIAPEALPTDGHPSWDAAGRRMLTDTYGDPQELILYDAVRQDAETLGRFATSDTVKCDLHPRWDREEQQIAVDVMPRGSHRMLVLELNR